MKTKYTLFFSLLFLGSPSLSRAADVSEARGARPYSLGNAFIGVADDGHAPFWNPAGIGQAERAEVTFTYGGPVVRDNQKDQNRAAFSAVEPGLNGGFPWGVYWVHSSTEGARRNNILALNLARGPWAIGSSKLFMGANLKFLNDDIQTGTQDDETAFGVDLGLLLKMNRWFSLGFVANDITRPRATAGSNNRMAATYGLGSAWSYSRNGLLALDVLQTEREDELDVRGGVEQWFFHRSVALRTGANKDAYTAGLGFHFPVGDAAGLGLDYGYSYPYRLNRDHRQHVASLRLEWGGTPGADKESDWGVESSSGVKKKAVVLKPPKKSLMKKVEAMKMRMQLTVGPEDVLEIAVRNHPELTTETSVDGWGFIHLPFIDELKVSGLTPDEIQLRLTEIFEGFVAKPSVKVTVKVFNSQVFYVFGQVRKPGKFPMQDNRITLRDAIVQAGLPTNRAAAWRVFIIHQGENGPAYRRVNLNRVLYKGVLNNNITLQSGDVVYVPMGVLDRIVTFIGRLVSPIVSVSRGIVTGN